MQCLKFSIIVSGLFCLVAVAPATAQDHAHHENAVTATATAPTPAQRWPTDAPLRAGMANIRTSVEALRYVEVNDISREEALAEVAMIDQSIGHIIANCKLDPDADAALHDVIAKLIHGSAGLRSDLKDKAAMAELRAALLEYQRLFVDPDWNSPTPVE